MSNFNNNIEDYFNFKNASKIVEIKPVKDNPEQREIFYQVSDELGNTSVKTQIVNIEYQKMLKKQLDNSPSDVQIKFSNLYEEFITDLENSNK